jgi:phosphoesterase RecJ-like protein
MSRTSVIAALRKHKRFLITTHVNMEGDALGAQLALGRLLRGMGKTVHLLLDDVLPYEYRFLPDLARIRRYNPASPMPACDCFVIADCSDLGRCGAVAKYAAACKEVVNIDHHITNDGFGSAHWVDARASSTSEMIYELYRAMHRPLDRNAAVQLYTGIFTDTGSFRYSNTSARTHVIAADLMRFKFDVAGLYRHVYEEVPYEDMRLLNAVASRIHRDASGKVVWVMLPARVLRRVSATFDMSEHLLQCARSIRGIEVAMLFKENLGGKHEIRVNFRAQGKVDVAKIARSLGGGGHRNASGCTVRGALDDVARMVLARVRRELP